MLCSIENKYKDQTDLVFNVNVNIRGYQTIILSVLSQKYINV